MGRKFMWGNAEACKRYREKNKEKQSAYYKERYQKNKEKRIEYSKEYRKSHREYYNDYNRSYYGKNKDKLAQTHMKRAREVWYYEKNREKIIAKAKEYYQKNKEKILARKRKS